MLGMWDVGGVGCWGCGMLGMRYVLDVGCSGRGMFGICDFRDVGCWGCGMLRTWDVGDVGCSGCGMFAGMWDVDLQNTYFPNDSTLPPQTLQAVVFGFSEKDKIKNLIPYNHLFLIFNLHVYRFRENGFLSIMSLVNQI